MEKIKEINICEAVINILDNNLEGPILNEYALDLTEQTYTFLYKHIQKVLRNKKLIYGQCEYSRIVELAREHMAGTSNIIETSKEMAVNFFKLMKFKNNIPSCDFITVTIRTEFGPMFVIAEMDYSKNYSHQIVSTDGGTGIDITEQQGLSIKSKINKCALIKATRNFLGADLLLLDDFKEEKQYFTENFICCQPLESDKEKTEKLIKTVEEFARQDMQEKHTFESEQLRRVLRENLKQDQIEISDIINIIPEELKKEFETALKLNEINKSVQIDKDIAQEKLNKIKIKTNNIEVSLNDETYNDISKFEVVKNTDGSVNFVIKNVTQYIEK